MHQNLAKKNNWLQISLHILLNPSDKLLFTLYNKWQNPVQNQTQRRVYPDHIHLKHYFDIVFYQVLKRMELQTLCSSEAEELLHYMDSKLVLYLVALVGEKVKKHTHTQLREWKSV